MHVVKADEYCEYFLIFRYEYMLKCWSYNPDDRPKDFEELKDLCIKSLQLFVNNETTEDNVSVISFCFHTFSSFAYKF
jgi:hypothetical protein